MQTKQNINIILSYTAPIVMLKKPEWLRRLIFNDSQKRTAAAISEYSTFIGTDVWIQWGRQTITWSCEVYVFGQSQGPLIIRNVPGRRRESRDQGSSMKRDTPRALSAGTPVQSPNRYQVAVRGVQTVHYWPFPTSVDCRSPICRLSSSLAIQVTFHTLGPHDRSCTPWWLGSINITKGVATAPHVLSAPTHTMIRDSLTIGCESNIML